MNIRRNLILFTLVFISIAVWAEENHYLMQSIELHLVPGKNWKSTMWFGPIPVQKTPQLACWIETADSQYVTTLTITSRSAAWFESSKRKRPESLPVWTAAASKVVNSVDMVSSATPKAGIALEKDLDKLISGVEYRIRLEVNVSFDYNNTWSKNAKKGMPGYSGVNGQPSLVYEARFIAGEKKTHTLIPIGTGSIDGSTGDCTPGVEGLTTALSIIESATVTVH